MSNHSAATRNRQPKGVSTGGQFAAEAKSETGLNLTAPAPAADEPVIEPTGPAVEDERLCDETPFAAVVSQPALVDGVPGTIHAAYTTTDYGPVAVERTTYLSREKLLAGHATGSPERLLAGATKDFAYETILSLVAEQEKGGIQMDYSGTPENPKPEPVGTPAGPSAGIVDTLPWPVPDLSEDVQAKTGLPADFTEAFDTYFADAAEALDAHDGDAGAAVGALHGRRQEALRGLRDAFPQVVGFSGDGTTPIVTSLPENPGSSPNCWELETDDGSGAVTITWSSGVSTDDYGGSYWQEGPSLRTQDAGAVQNAQAAWSADTTIHRLGQLERIRTGEDAPWNFLPTTHRQAQRAQTVREQYQPQIRDMDRKLDGYDRTGWVEQYAGPEQYREQVLGEFTETTIPDPDRPGRVQAWQRAGDTRPKYTGRPQVEAAVEVAVSRYRQASARRANLAPEAHQQAAQREEMREKVRYYRQIAGWPGGDMSPQQSSDGSWSFFVEDPAANGGWRFVDAPAKG